MKSDWQLIETDRVLYKSAFYNNFVRLGGRHLAHLSPKHMIHVAALYIESIDDGGIFKDINKKFQYRIEGLPDPIMDYHAVNKRYIDGDNTIVRHNKDNDFNNKKI